MQMAFKKKKIGNIFTLKDKYGEKTKYTITSKRGADHYNKTKPKTEEDFQKTTRVMGSSSGNSKKKSKKSVNPFDFNFF